MIIEIAFLFTTLITVGSIVVEKQTKMKVITNKLSVEFILNKT
jgi:hypothetical protein